MGREGSLRIIKRPDAATRIRDDVVAAFGRLDILVNNAGGSRPFDGLGTRQQWDEAMALNFMPVGNSPMPSYP
ncbi:SDR family NAD(P)-dependent oxidoreductase [Bradyrhizobium sp. LB12.1]|uniref:SDR family NAD(P)-dependent oxidoreductase n=1 Tax=unclassified Bradyrhizobium TaxID=2631580 RepID=UPI003396FE74